MKGRSVSPYKSINNAISTDLSGEEDPNDEQAKDSIFFEPMLFARLMAKAGFSLKKFATVHGMGHNTLRGVERGNGINPTTAKFIADKLGVTVLDLLAPWDRRYQPPKGQMSQVEWDHDGYLGKGTLASNNLYFIPCRMKHKTTANKLGRGKYYHLSLLKLDVRQDMQHKLSRHSDVCANVGQHPHVAMNYSSGATATCEGWWVIDAWVGNESLEQKLQTGPWPVERLPGMLQQVASGLDALHRAGVIMRELAPSHVLLTDDLTRAVITDFELAKLLAEVPSVSGEWQDGDRFRAPEITGTNATAAADLYSFAQLAVAAINGGLPEEGQESECLSGSSLPPKLRKLFLQCLMSSPSKRPQEIGPLLDELNRWAEKSRA
ncbi:MAG: protein kinase [Planctomycetaceae bacterium]|nr:protein kinase [Planctomycetaceae bacterium]